MPTRCRKRTRTADSLEQTRLFSVPSSTLSLVASHSGSLSAIMLHRRVETELLRRTTLEPRLDSMDHRPKLPRPWNRGTASRFLSPAIPRDELQGSRGPLLWGFMPPVGIPTGSNPLATRNAHSTHGIASAFLGKFSAGLLNHYGFPVQIFGGLIRPPAGLH